MLYPDGVNEIDCLFVVSAASGITLLNFMLNVDANGSTIDAPAEYQASWSGV